MHNTMNRNSTPTLATAVELDPQTHIDQTIAANIAGVDIVIRRPSGKYQIKDVAVEATDDIGNREKLDTAKVTRPCFIIDSKNDHHLWADLNENEHQLNRILARFSVSDARRGFHLVPMTKVGAMLAALREKRHERLDLARKLADVWDSEVIPKLRAKYNGHYYLLAPNLPSPLSLVERFDTFWTLHPLTPLNAADLRFDQINSADQQEIINESNNMAAHLIKSRARVIYAEVFGSLLSKCDEITSGGMQSGRRKFGALTELVDLLARLKNFHEFATPDVLAKADQAMALINGISSITEVNANEGQNQVTAAITAAFRPLGDSIDRMLRATMPQAGRARRQVIL